jgi:hypothetical protein
LVLICKIYEINQKIEKEKANEQKKYIRGRVGTEAAQSRIWARPNLDQTQKGISPSLSPTDEWDPLVSYLPPLEGVHPEHGFLLDRPSSPEPKP